MSSETTPKILSDFSRCESSGENLATVYVGNLPFGTTEEHLLSVCTKEWETVVRAADFSVKFRVERIRPKRGFAFVEVVFLSNAPLDKEQTLNHFVQNLAAVAIGGRHPVVELQGESAVHELRKFCAERGLPFPNFTPVEDENVEGGLLLRAELQDGTLVCPPQKGKTLKAAKRACASACLDFLKTYTKQSLTGSRIHDTQAYYKNENNKFHKPETDAVCLTTSCIPTASSSPEIAALSSSPEEKCCLDSSQPATTDDKKRVTYTRNCSIIAHVDHGKTTLSDSLLAKAGLLSKRRAGLECSLDTTEQERERGITIHSTAVSLSFPAQHLVPDLCEKEACKCQDVATAEAQLDVNLIDCPGHVDFNAEVVASLRITDGAVIVVDAVEGVCVQTNILLRQALAERVKPVLMLNKCDRLFIEKQLNAEDAYDHLVSTITHVNAIIEEEGAKLGMDEGSIEQWKVFLEDGSAIIGSGYFGWAFDVDHVVEKLVRVKREKLQSTKDGFTTDGDADATARLKTKLRKWRGLARSEFRQAFVNRLLKPLMMVHKLCLDDAASLDDPHLASFLKRQQINSSKWTADDIAKVKSPKDLLRIVMRAWAPAANCLVKLIALHLPSPEEAQRSRVCMFYSPPQTSDMGDRGLPIMEAMERCDPNGPPMLYITKVVQLGGTSGSIAVGRLFSGQIVSGSTLSVLLPEGNPDANKAKVKVGQICIKRILQLKGGKTISVEVAKAGDIFGLATSKVENSIRGATLTSHPLPEGHNLRPFAPLPLKASPVVRVAVKAVRGGEHASKLRTILKTLSDSDPCLEVSIDQETGENILCGAGELHLETAVHSLRDTLGAGIRLEVTPPMVSYRESLSSEGIVCLAKTANKLNRIWVKATPLQTELVRRIQNENVACMPATERTRMLVSEFGWEKSHANKIWCFGPESSVEGKSRVGTNVLVDSTVGLANMDTLRGDVQAAFQKLCEKGPLAGEQLCGIRFDIVDAKIHADAAHRRTAQILPAAMRAFSAAVLSASPALLEPLYEASVRCQQSSFGPSSCQSKSDVGAVYSLIGKHGATLVSHDVEVSEGGVTSGCCVIKASLPVLSAAAFMSDLRTVTSGRAFVDVRFDRYAVCIEHRDRGEAAPLIKELRSRNKMSVEVPAVNSIVDKL